jgi:hypothetical protein
MFDRPSAKFLWKRISPKQKAKHAELQGLWNVCISLWNGAPVFPALSACSWSDRLLPAIVELKEKEAAKAMDLLARSFSVVKASHVAGVLGQSQEQAVALATGRGWTHAADTASLTPPEPGPCHHVLTFSKCPVRFTFPHRLSRSRFAFSHALVVHPQSSA